MPYPTQWTEYDPSKFMCCMCFQILDVSEAAVDEAGQKFDLCVPCMETEIEMKKLLSQKKPPL